jgi:pyruvate formate lyase activating enzyme
MTLKESRNIGIENYVSIFGASAMSVVDGPGVRTVVFFQGCPVNCIWCHSPHSRVLTSPLLFFEQNCRMCMRCQQICNYDVHIFQSDEHIIRRELCRQCGECINACPESSVENEGSVLLFPTKKVTPEFLLEQLLPYITLCDGITLSGGEALLQENATEFLRLCKEKNIHVCVETSGLLDKNCYMNALPYVDVWLFGIRVLTDRSANLHTKKLISNCKLIKSRTNVIIPAIPLIPGITENILQESLSVMEIINPTEIWLNPWNQSYDVYYKAMGIESAFPKPSKVLIKQCEEDVQAFFRKKGFKTVLRK